MSRTITCVEEHTSMAASSRKDPRKDLQDQLPKLEQELKELESRINSESAVLTELMDKIEKQDAENLKSEQKDMQSAVAKQTESEWPGIAGSESDDANVDEGDEDVAATVDAETAESTFPDKLNETFVDQSDSLPVEKPVSEKERDSAIERIDKLNRAKDQLLKKIGLAEESVLKDIFENEKRSQVERLQIIFNFHCQKVWKVTQQHRLFKRPVDESKEHEAEEFDISTRFLEPSEAKYFILFQFMQKIIKDSTFNVLDHAAMIEPILENLFRNTVINQSRELSELRKLYNTRFDKQRNEMINSFFLYCDELLKDLARPPHRLTPEQLFQFGKGILTIAQIRKPGSAVIVITFLPMLAEIYSYLLKSSQIIDLLQMQSNPNEIIKLFKDASVSLRPLIDILLIQLAIEANSKTLNLLKRIIDIYATKTRVGEYSALYVQLDVARQSIDKKECKDKVSSGKTTSEIANRKFDKQPPAHNNFDEETVALSKNLQRMLEMSNSCGVKFTVNNHAFEHFLQSHVQGSPIILQQCAAFLRVLSSMHPLSAFVERIIKMPIKGDVIVDLHASVGNGVAALSIDFDKLSYEAKGDSSVTKAVELYEHFNAKVADNPYGAWLEFCGTQLRIYVELADMVKIPKMLSELEKSKAIPSGSPTPQEEKRSGLRH